MSCIYAGVKKTIFSILGDSDIPMTSAEMWEEAQVGQALCLQATCIGYSAQLLPHDVAMSSAFRGDAPPEGATAECITHHYAKSEIPCIKQTIFLLQNKGVRSKRHMKLMLQDLRKRGWVLAKPGAIASAKRDKAFRYELSQKTLTSLRYTGPQAVEG